MGSTPIIRSIDLGQKSYSFLSFLLFYATFKANKLCLKIVVAFLVAQNNGLKTQILRGYTQNITTQNATTSRWAKTHLMTFLSAKLLFLRIAVKILLPLLLPFFNCISAEDPMHPHRR